ncbi:MAG: 2-oxo acid dehydrogenase subunit E2 [Myxococcota bacterium]
MPRLSSDEGTATLSSWLVAEGDSVEAGAIIAELETDKATVELEAPVAGRIESLRVTAGTEGLKPGAELGRIVPSASATRSRRTDAEREPDPTPDAVSHDAREAAPADEGADPVGRSPATPLARRVARSKGIDLGRVQGTGLGGRIEKADVDRSGQADAEAADPGIQHDAADSPDRARSMASSGGAAAIEGAGGAGFSTGAATPRARSTPDFAGGDGPRPAVQLKLRCRMEATRAVRARLNEGLVEGASGAHATLNDFVVRAAARALREVPGANLRSEAAGDRAGRGGAAAVDIALVVATDSGSGVVRVRDADRKGLAVLSTEIRSAADGLRAGGPREVDVAASILVTSFGRFGIESAHPMLPQGQVAVLAVGAVVEEPVVLDGAIGVGARMTLTLAFDPTVVGGAVMARLLAAIRDHLEDPLGMLL